MRTLSIDIETYSPVDLKKAGVFPYCAHRDFQILLFGYAFDNDPVKVVDLRRGEVIPPEVERALYDPEVLKTAFNASFEIACINSMLSRMGWEDLIVDQWECTMVKAAMLGLPMSLAKVAEALRLPQQKMGIGVSLIRYFCIPCKPTAANGHRERNLPSHDLDKWELFKSYCGQDVVTERAIRNKLAFFSIPEKEHRLWVLDQKINTRGVLIDREFVENAIRMDETTKERLINKAIRLTNLDNPNSGTQLKKWLEEAMDEEIESLTKKVIPLLLKKSDNTTVTQVLLIRQELAKTSVKKYQAMINAVGEDNRIRGLTQFYGANRTGRFCLAEGTEILVKNTNGIYLKPIQCVLTTDKVWDGDNWVSHEGVVFNGRKKVIHHGGITATEDHYVWISPTKKIKLGEAKACNIFLWKGNYSWYSKFTPKGSLLVSYVRAKEINTYDIINAGPKNRFMANGRIVSNSGRYVQLQNLPQNHIVTLDEARSLVKNNDLEFLELLYGNVPDTLSQLIRTAFVAPEGKLLYVADFSAIEARVIAWLADEQWRLDVFATHGKIYEASASQMFKVPIESIHKGSELRQKGKVAELACIAEGQLVRTTYGLVPIQDVTPAMKVWDGSSFVSHTGVVSRGIKPCMTYQGLTATLDHVVFTLSEKSMPLFHAFLKSEDINRKDKDHPSFSQGKFLPTYDILNCGPNHRFEVSGVLVHNCGYGGGVGALENMGALEMGVKKEELKELIDAWREANPAIVDLWYKLENAAKRALKTGEKVMVKHGVGFEFRNNILYMLLPSGRKLAYVRPRLGQNRFGGESIQFEGMDQTTKKWGIQETYSGKLAENATQAIARDCLCESMLNLDAAGYEIDFHVHDEVVIEHSDVAPDKTLKKITEIMGQPIDWAPGLLLRADGYFTPYYKKD